MRAVSTASAGLIACIVALSSVEAKAGPCGMPFFLASNGTWCGARSASMVGNLVWRHPYLAAAAIGIGAVALLANSDWESKNQDKRVNSIKFYNETRGIYFPEDWSMYRTDKYENWNNVLVFQRGGIPCTLNHEISSYEDSMLTQEAINIKALNYVNSGKYKKANENAVEAKTGFKGDRVFIFMRFKPGTGGVKPQYQKVGYFVQTKNYRSWLECAVLNYNQKIEADQAFASIGFQ